MDTKFEEEVVDVAHRHWWQIFEVIFGVPFLAAIALQFAVPFSLPQELLPPAVFPGGIVLISIGVVLIILARREFTQHKQPTDPEHPTSKLVTKGVFSISRNPLYLGGVCIVVGAALTLNLAWVLVLLPIALIACHYILIVPEEQYLAAKFGMEYHAYANSVYRWIGCTKQGGSE